MVRLTNHAIVSHMVLFVNGIDTCRHMLFNVAAHVVREMFGHCSKSRSMVEIVARVKQLTARHLGDAAVFRNVSFIPGGEPVLQLWAVTIKTVLLSENEQVPDRRDARFHLGRVEAAVEQPKPDFQSR